MQSGPMSTGKPGSLWATELSWKLVCRRIVMRSTSPRSTAPGQTLTPSSSTTSPITTASGQMNTSLATTGVLSP